MNGVSRIGEISRKEQWLRCIAQWVLGFLFLVA